MVHDIYLFDYEMAYDSLAISKRICIINDGGVDGDQGNFGSFAMLSGLMQYKNLTQFYNHSLPQRQEGKTFSDRQQKTDLKKINVNG